MIVLSLCDGMSCGQIALDKLGAYVEKYFASEIDSVAIKVTQSNYPRTVQIGNVQKVHYKDGILYTEKGSFAVPKIDLVMFGSPCQSLSIANANRDGLAGKSGIFYDCYRVLQEVKPKYFLFENVASMEFKYVVYFTQLFGVQPLFINSSLVSAQNRKRIYWTNIPCSTLPTDKKILANSILEYGAFNKPKINCLTAIYSRPFNPNNKCKNNSSFNLHVYDDKGNKRLLTQHEMERLQTVPDGYTDCLTWKQAAQVLGNGWTVDIIAHILSFMEV